MPHSTYNNTVKSVEKTDSLYMLTVTAYCKKQQFWHLQLNIVTRKHRCIVHFSDSVIDVGLPNCKAGWSTEVYVGLEGRHHGPLPLPAITPAPPLIHPVLVIIFFVGDSLCQL